LTSRLGMDLIDHEHPLFVGRPGTYGDRAANFTVQNSDLFLSIGCRLAIGLVGYDFEHFAERAYRIHVDIDQEELNKPSVTPHLGIQMDAASFLQGLMEQLGDYIFEGAEWVAQTQLWKKKYPVDLPEYQEEREGINSYHFMRRFSETMPSDAAFALDTGSCFHVHAQAFKVKKGQRHIITGGLSTMGYMPAVIGLAAAHHGKDIYCITGDGSIQMNLQELQTLVQHKYPVKIIILNNNGYLLIRHSQNNFLNGRKIGESVESGISFPNMEKIARAYGIDYMRMSSIEEMEEKLETLSNHQGTLICEVITPSNQLLIPRVSSKQLEDGRMVSMPYDDMFPFLSRDEYQVNCIQDTTI